MIINYHLYSSLYVLLSCPAELCVFYYYFTQPESRMIAQLWALNVHLFCFCYLDLSFSITKAC